MQSDSAVEEVSAPELSVEEVWCGAEGPASIAELALEQRGVHYPLVQHHCLLASLLHATMTFSLKVKPLSLFDSKVRKQHTHTHTFLSEGTPTEVHQSFLYTQEYRIDTDCSL